MIRTATACALTCLLAATSLGAPKTAEWHTDLGEARREAWERGVPLLIFLSRFE